MGARTIDADTHIRILGAHSSERLSHLSTCLLLSMTTYAYRIYTSLDFVDGVVNCAILVRRHAPADAYLVDDDVRGGDTRSGRRRSALAVYLPLLHGRHGGISCVAGALPCDSVLFVRLVGRSPLPAPGDLPGVLWILVGTQLSVLHRSTSACVSWETDSASSGWRVACGTSRQAQEPARTKVLQSFTRAHH